MAILDPETQKQLTDADEVELMLGGTAWGIVKGKLDAKILDLQNIMNIDDSSPEKMALDLKSRLIASKLLFDWLKHDVYGFVEQQRQNLQAASIDRQEGFIERESAG